MWILSYFKGGKLFIRPLVDNFSGNEAYLHTKFEISILFGWCRTFLPCKLVRIFKISLFITCSVERQSVKVVGSCNYIHVLGQFPELKLISWKSSQSSELGCKVSCSIQNKICLLTVKSLKINLWSTNFAALLLQTFFISLKVAKDWLQELINKLKYCDGSKFAWQYTSVRVQILVLDHCENKLFYISTCTMFFTVWMYLEGTRKNKYPVHVLMLNIFLKNVFFWTLSFYIVDLHNFLHFCIGNNRCLESMVQSFITLLAAVSVDKLSWKKNSTLSFNVQWQCKLEHKYYNFADCQINITCVTLFSAPRISKWNES